MLFFPIGVNANIVTWNINSIYSVTQTGIANAFSDARLHFNNLPNDTVVLHINAGTDSIGGNGSYGIDLTGGINPGPNGRLVFEGAGMDSTILVFTEMSQREIMGRNLYRITFRNMHMTRATYTVSQGIVVNVLPGQVILNIQSGFPTPADIWDTSIVTAGGGRFLRQYTNSQTNPQLVYNNYTDFTSVHNQIAWDSAKLVSGSIWKIFLHNPTQVAYYSPGNLIGIKSKHEGEVYWIQGGSDIIFENIKWTQATRGLVRGGTSNVTVRGCRIERSAPINGQTPCMASPSGGPQMNQPTDSVSTNMVVENCYIESPGDDAVAFFRVNGGKLINSYIRDVFSGRVNVTDSAKNICIYNNYLVRDTTTGTYNTCSDNIQTLFVFTGTGNWSNASNWMNNIIPPVILPVNSEIVLTPYAGGECVLDQSQTILKGSKLTIEKNTQFRIIENLFIH
jgi:hypothetical protein